MLSIFDSVNELLGKGDTISALSQGLGIEGPTAQKAAGSAAPVLLSGLADRAQEPGGAAAVMGMLDNVDSSSIDGAGLLDGIFGSKLGGVMDSVAGSTGLGVGTVGKLLPMLAPMIMGIVAKRRMSDGLDGAGLTNVLIGEQATMERDGFLSGGLGKLGGAAAAGGAVLGGAAAANGKLGDVASGAAGKLGSVGDVATGGIGSVGKVGDLASGATGELKTVGGAVTDGLGGTVTGGADKLGGAVTGGAGKLGGAVAGGAGAVGGAVGGARPDIGGSGGRFGKFGWIIGAIVAVAVAAWALSQCGGSDVVDTATGAIDDAVETVEETVEDAAETVEDAAEEVVETVEEVVDYQPGVDSALAASGIAGVNGVIDDAGVVTLTGEVESEEAKAAAEAATAGVEGVTSVKNMITVVAAEAAPAAGSTINEILNLDPITFAVNSAEITAEGQAVLGSAVEFMAANPTVNVEIAGHTDSDGDTALNEALSQDRADSVKAFLVDNGVEAERMTTKGYGESAPKVENDTPENKAINRRIEFTIQ